MTSTYKEKPLITKNMHSEADMLKEFGPRCPEYDAGCVVCKGWLEWDLRHNTDWKNTL